MRENLRDLSAASREEAALRLVLRSTQELRGLEMLFPDDGRTESPPPLIERFREVLGELSLADLKAAGNSREQPSRVEMEAFAAAVVDGGFNGPPEPGALTRPGPEETPLQRVARQIGHIKVLPDPYDFSIEELGPWDTAVSEEWKRLPEEEKLSRLAQQVDWRDISADEKSSLLEREVDFTQVPGETQERFLASGSNERDDAARAPASATLTFTSSEDRGQADLVSDFGARIETLKRGGVPSYPPLERRKPWAQTPEREKLEAIVWESTTVWLGAGSFRPDADGHAVIAVPGTATLTAVEEHVDYAGLPPVQREMLEDLRAKLHAGQLGGADANGKDLVAMGLARVVGVGHFDEMLQAAKESKDRPWAEVPEADKVPLIVDMAQEAGPPGTYVLAAIERDVDYGKLPSWRRGALEGLRAGLNRGELDGENPNPAYQGDRAELALRLAELEARVEDGKQFGISTKFGQHWAWPELREEQKLDRIEWEIRELHLNSEARAYAVIDREVDLTARTCLVAALARNRSAAGVAGRRSA